MYTCIVIDDEKLARARITEFIQQQPHWQVIGEAGEYQEAADLLCDCQPDLSFLDINIIGGSGVDLAFKLNHLVDTAWVFTTAYQDFALKAFELAATDYLLKPFENKRLKEVLTKVERRNKKHKNLEKKHLAVKSIGAVQFIDVDEIIWIKGSANYVELHCKDKMLFHRETMNNLEQQLSPSKFARVHRSAMVNLSKIESLNSELGRYSLLQMSNGEEVKIS